MRTREVAHYFDQDDDARVMPGRMLNTGVPEVRQLGADDCPREAAAVAEWAAQVEA
jgi:hypothetical protein